jgi:CheY-like chemotaxis protein
MPVVARSEAEPSDDEETATGGNSETILVVEDEPGVRNLTCTALSHRGYNVLRAANGDDAIAAFDAANEPPDLLLTDIVMPGQSGPQVAAALMARRPGLKVIYMSGYLDRGGEQESPIDTADILLRKPFSPEVLAQVVRAVLDGANESATTHLVATAELELTAG